MYNKSIDYYLSIAEQNTSIPIETTDGWAEWVARPVIKYNLAPREARAILEIVGTLKNSGCGIKYILGLLLPKLNNSED